MLLRDYQIRIVLPECNFSAEKVNAIVNLSDDISEVLPYLNRILKGLHYIDQSKILTVKMQGRLVTFRPREISLTKLEDEKEAQAVMEKLKRIINETYEKRAQIEPDYSTAKELKPSEVVKLFPGTNCRECGEKTCFSFVYKLLRHETDLSKCRPLFSHHHVEKRAILFKLLEESGYAIPQFS